MTNNQLAESSVIQLLNSVKLARDNAERADNRVDHSFYYALTIALEELQERRKADSEPVAEVVSIYGDPEAFGEREIRPLVGIQQMPYGTKLYRHAQPAPVVDYVPLGDSPYDAPCSMPSNLRELIAEEIGILFSDDDAQSVWNVCRRAAMLATAPQSPGGEPATVPGKWIPVSERMPEVGDIVLTAMGGVVNVGEMECSAANCRFFTSVISGRELPATHWMPLPAAPQEVNRE
ncbi:Eaa1 [Klebsiella pneumoniae]|nr:Eaa1 [Klebsiella pneumoniae]